MSLLDVAGQRVLLVASTGGHLAELVRLHPRLAVAPDSTWVTFDSPQSRALLAGRDVTYVPYVAPRDAVGVVRAAALLREPVRRGGFGAVISTGAALALAALPLVRRTDRAIYVESVSRFEGPSLTGRILAGLPGVELYSQHAGWAHGRWRHEFSVLSDYASLPVTPPDRPLRVFVTLGTIRPYRFDALLVAVQELTGALAEVRWQTGASSWAPLTGEQHELMSPEAFDEAVRWADVVVSHAGVGSALRALDLGRVPVLVPRRSARNEHVDDHQVQIARHLHDRGLALCVEAPDLVLQDLLTASALTVTTTAAGAPR